MRGAARERARARQRERERARARARRERERARAREERERNIARQINRAEYIILGEKHSGEEITRKGKASQVMSSCMPSHQMPHS